MNGILCCFLPLIASQVEKQRQWHAWLLCHHTHTHTLSLYPLPLTLRFQMTPAAQLPEDTAIDFVIAPFDTQEHVVGVARQAFAQEIALHPEVRMHWRERFMAAIAAGGGVFVKTRPTRAGYDSTEPWERFGKFRLVPRTRVALCASCVCVCVCLCVCLCVCVCVCVCLCLCLCVCVCLWLFVLFFF